MEVVASNENPLPDGSSYTTIKNLNRDTLLPDNLQGQYLFLKIYLIGDQTLQNSPTIKSLRVIYPRSTYLEYLPTYYHENEKSAMILERFFSIFETTFLELEERRANTPSLIDSKETSKKNLAWLSSWLGLTYDESWDEKSWRKLISEAPKLFDIRGTRKGIERVIEIYSGTVPLIQEPMHRRCQKDKDIDNYSFCVFLKPEQYNNMEEVKTIRRIVEEWKPAYTKASVVPLEHNILLGSYVFLEINTKLEKRKVHLGDVRIPFGGLAPATEGDMRSLERVRIDSDAILH
nr:phage tail protein [Sulfurovum sp. bin170]